MSYVEKNLGRNETIVLKAKKHFLTIFSHPIAFFTTELALTNKSVIGKAGLANSKSLNSPLNKVQNVSVASTLFGKIFKYGTIEVSTAAGSMKFRGIKNAEKFKTAVLNQMDIYDEEKTKAQAQQMASAMASAIKNQ